MKRKILSVLAAALLLLPMMSCAAGGGQNETMSTPSASPVSPVHTETASTTPATAPATSEATDSAAPGEDTTAEASDGEDQTGNADMSDPEFSFQVGSLTLTLREHAAAKLTMLPLSQISDTTEVLGAGSDTFTGSVVRTVLYEGFELKLFAPKDNPEDFWIMQMTATTADTATYRGIRVGDSLQTLEDTYPEAEVGEDGTFIYTGSKPDAFDELTFTVGSGVLTQIQLTFYLP